MPGSPTAIAVLHPEAAEPEDSPYPAQEFGCPSRFLMGHGTIPVCGVRHILSIPRSGSPVPRVPYPALQSECQPCETTVGGRMQRPWPSSPSHSVRDMAQNSLTARRRHLTCLKVRCCSHARRSDKFTTPPPIAGVLHLRALATAGCSKPRRFLPSTRRTGHGDQRSIPAAAPQRDRLSRFPPRARPVRHVLRNDIAANGTTI